MYARTTAAAALLATLTAACGRDSQNGAPDHAMPGQGAAAGQGMHMDPAMMRRHAAEADSVVARLREHISSMRTTPPERRSARMAEHAGRVSDLLNLITRQVREMDMGMGMSDADMGGMMGLSAAEYRETMDAVASLRAETERLQVAPGTEVHQRLSAHLDRIEELNERLERMARHMRMR